MASQSSSESSAEDEPWLSIAHDGRRVSLRAGASFHSTNWFERQLNVLQRAAMWLLFSYSVPVLVIVLWVMIGSVNPASLGNFFYLLCCVLLFPVRNGLYLAAPVSLMAATWLVARYMFQFSSLVTHAGVEAQWWGFVDFRTEVMRFCAGDVIIVALATIHRLAYHAVPADGAARSDSNAAATKLSTYGRWTHPRASSDAKVEDVRRISPPAQQLLGKPTEVRTDPQTATVTDHSKDSQSGGFKPVESAELKSNTTWLFVRALLLDLIRILWTFIRTLFVKWGAQICIFVLLLTCFARSNAASLMYLIVICGIYHVAGRRLAAKLWPGVVTLLGAR